MIVNVPDNDNDVHDKHLGPDCDQFCRWFELLVWDLITKPGYINEARPACHCCC